MNQPYVSNGWNRIARTTRRLVLIALLGTLVLMLTVPASVLAGATAPNLGTAGGFGVLAGSAVTNTGSTQVTGDVGISPGSAVTGFPPGVASGTIHAGDAVAAQARNDATIAYNNSTGQACDLVLTGQDLGGMTLTPGVYCFASSAQLTGQLTLDGQNNPNSVFIFQVGSTLTTASNARVSVINGAQPCRIFWQVGSSATLGTNTHFAGNILAATSITLNTGATTSSGLYALNGAVTLDTNNIQACGTAQGATNTPTPVSTDTATATRVPPTNTSAPIATNTPTSTSTVTATATRVPPTNTSTSTPVAASTSTATATTPATALPSTATSIPGATNTPVPQATNTSTPVATNTQINTPTSIPTSTPGPRATDVPTETPGVVNTVTPSGVATLAPSNTAVPSQTAVPNNTALPNDTATAVALATNSVVPSTTAIATGTAVMTATETSIVATPTTAMAIGTATVAATVVSTSTPIATVTVPRETSVTTETTTAPTPIPFLPRTGGGQLSTDPFALPLGMLLLLIGLNIRMRVRKVGRKAGSDEA